MNQTKSLLQLIGRTSPLFQEDLSRHGDEITEKIRNSRFLVVGGAGSIGGAVVKELFERNPRVLHVIDTSENNLAELVRDLRASVGYTDGEFHAYCFDVLGDEFEAFSNSIKDADSSYDYVLNFSALKHVRSEKDPYTLMRLIDVNVFLTRKLLDFAREIQAKKFFCVSTDKAANPVNMMGASKRIMEMFLLDNADEKTDVSTARFANVAFSDGSLPYSWTKRILKQQPIAAPNDIRRYFVTEQEGAQLCLFSILKGNDRDIFFPKLSANLHLITFSSMAEKYLRSIGYEPHVCETEDEARADSSRLIAERKWPCFFFPSDTTGEKDFEEFFTDAESVDLGRFSEIGIVQNDAFAAQEKLRDFEESVTQLRRRRNWDKNDLLKAFEHLLPEFAHKETGKYLDNRM